MGNRVSIFHRRSNSERIASHVCGAVWRGLCGETCQSRFLRRGAEMPLRACLGYAIMRVMSSSRRTRKIVVLGSTNTDMVIAGRKIPVPGETVSGGRFRMTPGGKGANQAVAVARLSARPGACTFIAKVGDDLFGRETAARLKADDIDVRLVVDPIEPSGTALIMVDAKGQDVISVALGANGRSRRRTSSRSRTTSHGPPRFSFSWRRPSRRCSRRRGRRTRRASRSSSTPRRRGRCCACSTSGSTGSRRTRRRPRS